MAAPVLRKQTLVRIGAAALVAMHTLIACDGSQSPASTDSEETAQTTANEVFKRIEEARQLDEHGDRRAAIIELKDLLQEKPELVEARRLLGNFMLKTGDGDAAAKEIKRAIKLGLPPIDAVESLARAYLLTGDHDLLIREVSVPNDADDDLRAKLEAMRGIAQLQTGAPDRAKESFQHALESDPGSIDGHIGMIQLALSSSDLTAARGWIDSGLRANPESPALWTAKGSVAKDANSLDDARSAFSRALEIDPDHLLAQLELTDAFLMSGDYEAAKAAFEGIDPRYAKVAKMAFLRGSLAAAEKKYESAVDQLEAYLTAEPNDQRALQLLAYSQFATKRYEQAKVTIDRILAESAGSTNLVKLLAATRISLGEPADEQLDPLLAAEPESPELLALKAQSLRLQGRDGDAAVLLQQVSQLQPRSAEAQSLVGGELLEFAESAKAVAALEQAVALQPDAFAAQLKLVMGYLATGQRSEARRLLDELQKSHKDHGVVWELTGVLQAAEGDTDAAEKAFLHALDLDPGNVSALRSLGELELKSRRNAEKARTYYLRALEKRPDDLRTLLKLADLELMVGDRDAEIHHLDRAIEAHAEEIGPRVRLARARLALGDPESALVPLTGLPSEAQTDIEYLKARGEAHADSGDFLGAAEVFEALTTVDPGDADGFYGLAFSYGALGKLQEMKEALLRALALRPDAQAANELVVRLFALAEENREAQSVISELKSHHPEHPQIMLLEAHLTQKKGDSARALDLYRTATQKHPEDGTILRGLAQAQRFNGDLDAAGETLTKLLENRPDDLQARRLLASLEIGRGNTAEAEIQYRAILESEPQDAITLNNLAWLIREKQPEEALKAAEKAVELRSEDPSVIDTLGAILLEQGHTSRSLAVFERALALDPTNRIITYHKAEALAASGDNANAIILLEQALSDAGSFPERPDAEALLNSLRTRQ